MFRCLVFLIAIMLLPGCAEADENSSANRLVVEAVKLLNQAKSAQKFERQLELATEAEEKLNKIIERYPGSDAAVKLVTTGRVGALSLEFVASEKARYEVLAISARAEREAATCFAAPTRQCLWVQALATANKTRNTFERAVTLAEIATTQAKAGDVEQALETIGKALAA